MKVWLITGDSADYDFTNYWIVGVFKSEKKAKILLKENNFVWLYQRLHRQKSL